MRTEPMTLDALMEMQRRVVMNLSAVQAVLRSSQHSLSLLTALDDVGVLPPTERLELDAFLRSTLKFSEALLHLCAEEYGNDPADDERRNEAADPPKRRSPRAPRRLKRATRRNRAAVVSLVASGAQSTSREQEAQ